jgi:hypothetical protein
MNEDSKKFSSKIVPLTKTFSLPSFSKGDGSEELNRWNDMPSSQNDTRRPSVAIECDILKLDW